MYFLPIFHKINHNRHNYCQTLRIMKYTFLLLLLIFLTGLSPVNTFAQKNKSSFNKIKVPRSKRKSTASLARHLTKGISDDSLKVVAIASYMAIRYTYDYKSLKSGNWKKRSTKKLLKRKLFNELCFEASINCETVIGYTKSWNYEPYDSLIRAEHAWNVIQINGRWKPVDLSWSTGYLKQRKQWIRKHLYWWLKIPYKIKYKFVKELTHDYMFTPPKVFVQTHLPLQSYWQLLRTPIPIEVFEADTISNFFKPKVEKNEINFNYQIQRYRGLPEKDKHLKGALQAFDYNKKNHRILGLGYYNYTTVVQNEIDPKLSEKEQIEQLDSCISLYKISKTYYNQYKKDVLKEFKRRKKRNIKLNKY